MRKVPGNTEENTPAANMAVAIHTQYLRIIAQSLPQIFLLSSFEYCTVVGTGFPFLSTCALSAFFGSLGEAVLLLISALNRGISAYYGKREVSYGIKSIPLEQNVSITIRSQPEI